MPLPSSSSSSSVEGYNSSIVVAFFIFFCCSTAQKVMAAKLEAGPTRNSEWELKVSSLP